MSDNVVTFTVGLLLGLILCKLGVFA